MKSCLVTESENKMAEANLTKAMDQTDCLVTKFEYVVQNIDHESYRTTRLTLATWIAATIVLSTGVSFCLWNYERFGGDPQKRTIFNQLLGMLAVNNMSLQVVGSTTLICRLLFGPLSIDASTVMFINVNAAGSLAVLFTLNQIMVLRCLSVCLWKQSPPINDDFFGTFFHCLNFGLAAVLVFYGHTGGPPHKKLTYFLAGSYYQMEPVYSIRR